MCIHNTFSSIRKAILPPPAATPHPTKKKKILRMEFWIKPLNPDRLENQGHPFDNQAGLTAAHCSEEHLW